MSGPRRSPPSHRIPYFVTVFGQGFSPLTVWLPGVFTFPAFPGKIGCERHRVCVAEPVQSIR